MHEADRRAEACSVDCLPPTLHFHIGLSMSADARAFTLSMRIGCSGRRFASQTGKWHREGEPRSRAGRPRRDRILVAPRRGAEPQPGLARPAQAQRLRVVRVVGRQPAGRQRRPGRARVAHGQPAPQRHASPAAQRLIRLLAAYEARAGGNTWSIAATS